MEASASSRGVMPSVLCRVSGTENLVSRCTQGQATFLLLYTDFLLVRMIDHMYSAHGFFTLRIWSFHREII